MKRHYDRGARSTGYEVSGKVWLYNPRRRKGLLPKLQSPWEGSYTVAERVSEVTYRIRQGQRARPKVVHTPPRFQEGSEVDEADSAGRNIHPPDRGETVRPQLQRRRPRRLQDYIVDDRELSP